MDILNGYFFLKVTRQFRMYTYRIRGKRGPFKIILPASFCSFLTLPGMSGSPSSFSDYQYFYSFMDRNVHAHFYRQPISIDCQVLFIFFFSGRLCTDIVLFLIFRIGLIKSAVLSSGLSTGHLPIASEGTSYKMAMPVPFRISPCLSRPEIRRTSVSAIWPCSLFLYGHNIYPFFCHIFFIFISFRMVFSLFFGKGPAREIPFFHRKNNKEEQAGFRQSHEPNHAEPWLSIDYDFFVDK